MENLFNDIATDSFYVYSADITANPKYEFMGTAMDSVQVSLLPYETRSSYNWDHDFGACYKFPLSTNTMALIARVPAEYVSSAIKLFVFDIEKDSIVKTINLANTFGDAGDVAVYSSYIFKDEEKRMLMLTYYWSSYDHSVYNENDTTIDYWHNYYLFNLTSNSIDTLSKDSATICTNYSTILRKLAHE